MIHFFRPDGLFDKILSTTALIMVLMVVLEGARYYFTERGEPIRILQVETVNSPVAPGEILLVDVYREKERDCPLSSYRTAVNTNGRVYQIGTAISQGGPIGTGFVRVEYPIPEDLPNGEYVLHALLKYDCPDAVYLVQQPEVYFKVAS